MIGSRNRVPYDRLIDAYKSLSAERESRVKGGGVVLMSRSDTLSVTKRHDLLVRSGAALPDGVPPDCFSRTKSEGQAGEQATG